MSRYLYLLWQLVCRDIASRYRGTLMGMLWSFMSPIIMLVIYTFVFSVVFNARWGSDGQSKTDFAMNVFAGMLVHGLLAECLVRSPALLLQYSSYVKRVVFPLAILPLLVVGSALFNAVISIIVLLCALLILGSAVHSEWLLLPVILLPLIFFAAGAGWLLSSCGAYLRDISQLTPVLPTVLMFMSPVFYPVSALPDAYQRLMYVNPLTPSIEAVRGLLFHSQFPELYSFCVSLVVSIIFAGFALFVFKRLSRGFADVL